MSIGDGEIIHRLWREDKHHRPDGPGGSIGLAHLIAGLQLAGRHLLAFSRIERVLRRRLDDLAVDAQVAPHGVLVHAWPRLDAVNSAAWRKQEEKRQAEQRDGGAHRKGRPQPEPVAQGAQHQHRCGLDQKVQGHVHAVGQ